MRGVSNQDDLNHATNIFMKHDHYHFISEVSISNLFTEGNRRIGKIKTQFL